MNFTKPKTLIFSLLAAIITLYFLILIAASLLGAGAFGTYGFTKTIGWAYEFTDIASVLSIVGILLFVFGYVFLWILKMRLNKIVSIVSLFLLFALPVVWFSEHVKHKYFLTFLMAFAVIVSVIINIVFAIGYKMKAKRKIS